MPVFVKSRLLMDPALNVARKAYPVRNRHATVIARSSRRCRTKAKITLFAGQRAGKHALSGAVGRSWFYHEKYTVLDKNSAVLLKSRATTLTDLFVLDRCQIIEFDGIREWEVEQERRLDAPFRRRRNDMLP